MSDLEDQPVYMVSDSESDEGRHRKNRYNNYDNTSDSSDHESSTILARFLFQNQVAGPLIGKGGNTIKNMMVKSGAKLFLSDNHDGDERILSVTGTRKEIVRSCGMIYDVLHDIEVDGKRDGRSVGHQRRSESRISLDLIVPSVLLGSIIGKSGTVIKEVRQKSGTSVVIPHNNLDGSTERLISISGLKESLCKGISMILKIIIENPPKSNVTIVKYHPEPRSDRDRTISDNRENRSSNRPINLFDTGIGPSTSSSLMGSVPSFVPPLDAVGTNSLMSLLGGLVTASNVSNLTGLNATTTNIDSQRSVGGRRTGRYDDFDDLIDGVRSKRYRREEPSRFADDAFRSDRLHSNPDERSKSSAMFPSSSETVYVPSRYVGSIMGRGGSVIDEMRTISKSQIKLLPEPAVKNINGHEMRKVLVTGKTTGIAVVKALINMHVEDAKERDGDFTVYDTNFHEPQSYTTSLSHSQTESNGSAAFASHQNAPLGSSGGMQSTLNTNESQVQPPLSGVVSDISGGGSNNSTLKELAALLTKPDAVNALSTLVSMGKDVSGVLTSGNTRSNNDILNSTSSNYSSY